MIDREALPYRPAVGVMLLNRQGKVFGAQRLDSSLEAWQMPQGGLDDGEEAQAGALRELEEEAILAALEESGGNKSHAAKLLGISRKALYKRLAEMES